jgi:hypothetical protein
MHYLCQIASCTLVGTVIADHSPAGLVDEEVAVPSVGPGDHGLQSRAVLFFCDQHIEPAQGVRGVLPVHL